MLEFDNDSSDFVFATDGLEQVENDLRGLEESPVLSLDAER